MACTSSARLLTKSSSNRLLSYAYRLFTCRTNALRSFSHRCLGGSALPEDFAFYPDFFDLQEQKILLASSLRKLDALGTREFRRRRKAAKDPQTSVDTQPVASLFLPDELYEFEEDHYDGVIKKFREVYLTAWCDEDVPLVLPILDRLRLLMPKVETQTHLLHLGTEGEILPHIDNIHASGSWILGVSLGADRVMRMQSTTDEADAFQVLLPSGSVYLQRDRVRFKYQHSILKDARFQDCYIKSGQRVSIMIRDHIPFEQQGM